MKNALLLRNDNDNDISAECTSWYLLYICIYFSAKHTLRTKFLRICNTRYDKAFAFKDETRFFFSDTRSRLGHTWAWQGNYGSSLDFRYINRTRNYHESFPVSFFRLRVVIHHFHPRRWIILPFGNSVKLAIPLFPENETNAPGRRKYFSQYIRAELLLSRDHANIFFGRTEFAGIANYSSSSSSSRILASTRRATRKDRAARIRRCERFARASLSP